MGRCVSVGATKPTRGAIPGRLGRRVVELGVEGAFRLRYSPWLSPSPPVASPSGTVRITRGTCGSRVLTGPGRRGRATQWRATPVLFVTYRQCPKEDKGVAKPGYG
jgi:hypothetical protein